MNNHHYKGVINNQEDLVKRELENCQRKYGQNVGIENTLTPFFNETLQKYMCPPFWDSLACWPFTEANTTATMHCPSYIAGFATAFNATRKCTENGTWFVHKEINHIWANYSACSPDKITTVYTHDIPTTNGVSQDYEAVISTMKIVSITGHAASLTALVIAFCIMFFIKKLHCARNILHMNLFASYILRAFFVILYCTLFVNGMGLQNDFTNKNGTLYFHINYQTNNYECKILTTLSHYFTLTNYSWILMEGLYLNNLILRALFTDSNKNLIYHIIFGWGIPILIVIPWVTVRVLHEDTMCWTTNEFEYLIIFIPIVLSVLTNLVLFSIISIVLYKKLRTPMNENCQRHLKWAKSTLVLMPLFGVHYAVFLIFYVTDALHLWFICDRLFGSFQGFFVAVLYCFLNGEVKTELTPLIHSTLTYLATNRWSKFCFPFREEYLRCMVGRQSTVCTTMSCSSLNANGIIHRNSKSKWEMFQKGKLSANDKGKDHSCFNSSKTSRSQSKTSHTGLLLGNHKFVSDGCVETTLCFDKPLQKDKSETLIQEDEVSMLGSHC